jgi:pimeloyl-ACP methyl ester carboxylesterase
MPDFVSIGGARLEFAWHGPSPGYAPTVVFLHEGLGSIAQWRDFPAAVCARTGCGGLVYNRRGHGRSEPQATPHDIGFMHDEALDVLPRVLDSFEIAQPILVGHSDGASIALIYAGAGGDPSALVLEAPHVFVEEKTTQRIAELRDLYRTTDLRRKLARYHGDGTDALFGSWTDVWLDPRFRRWNIRDAVEDVRCRTLVVQGKADDYGSEEQVTAITSRIRSSCDARLLDNCGHAPHLDRRPTVEDLVVQFIRDN